MVSNLCVSVLLVSYDLFKMSVPNASSWTGSSFPTEGVFTFIIFFRGLLLLSITAHAKYMNT